MASYTGMSNLQNHPHRSGFDIGRKNAFTAKVGELLPVYWDISMPGDKYKFNVEYFTRTQPVETSAYTRLREYFDFYAVPLRLLWKSDFAYRDWETDRKSTRLNSSHITRSRMPSSA